MNEMTEDIMVQVRADVAMFLQQLKRAGLADSPEMTASAKFVAYVHHWCAVDDDIMKMTARSWMKFRFMLMTRLRAGRAAVHELKREVEEIAEQNTPKTMGEYSDFDKAFLRDMMVSSV